MERIIPKIIITIFILLAVVGIVNLIILTDKQKIYTVGVIYKKSESGKRGRTYYFKYFMENKTFEGKTNGLNIITTNDSGYIYIDLLKDNYNRYHVIEYYKVPKCFTLKNIPNQGWAKLPNNPCDSLYN